VIYIDHGLGNRLWDIDGNEYLDFHLGYGAMVAGHAHPKIVEAVKRQVERGTHFAQPTKDLDAVVVSTTEHTHAYAAVPALQLGKAVYCEKPLSRDVQECRAMRQAAQLETPT